MSVYGDDDVYGDGDMCGDRDGHTNMKHALKLNRPLDK